MSNVYQVISEAGGVVADTVRARVIQHGVGIASVDIEAVVRFETRLAYMTPGERRELREFARLCATVARQKEAVAIHAQISKSFRAAALDAAPPDNLWRA